MSIQKGTTLIAGKYSTGIDNKTITKGSSGLLQVTGNIEKNKKLVTFDWIGTQQEFEDQNIANLHPDWIWYITNDIQGITQYYTQSEVDALLVLKANQNLTNIDLDKISLSRVIETKFNPDGSWYRKFSDGYVEQGGQSIKKADWNKVTIIFPVPFKNTLYFVDAVTGYTAQTDSPCINEKTPTYFTCNFYNSTGNGNWYACGLYA